MATDFLSTIQSVAPARTKANDFIDILRDIRGNAADLVAAAQDPNCIYGELVIKYNAFNDAYSTINVQLAELLTMDTEIIALGAITTELSSLYADRLALNSLFADKATLDSLYADKATLDSLFADKAALDSIFADKIALNSIYGDKATLDSIYADKAAIDGLYASKAAIDRIYTSIDNVDDFVERYFGPLAAEPTVISHPALTEGDMYFDTVSNLMKVYTGVSWINAGSAVNGTAERYSYVVGTASGNYDGVSLNTFPAVYDVGYLDVYVEGIYLDPVDFVATNGVSVTIGTDLTVGDTVNMIGYGVFDLTNAAQIKTMYESNADTNAFTDAEKLALANIDSDAYTFTNKTLNDVSNTIHADFVHYEVQATEALLKGDILVAAGITDDTVIKVAKRSNLSQPVIGMAETDIGNGLQGTAASTGVMVISNNGWSVGDVLYPNATGGLTVTPTILDGNYNQAVAYVLKENATWATVQVNFHSGHDSANLVSYSNTTSGMAATNTQAAIDEVEGRVDTAESKLAGIEAGATADQLASEVPNTPAGNIAATDVQAAINELDTEKQALSEKGQANGYASLDAGGLVPAAQLPSYVDDVIESATYAALPVTGEASKIYVVIADETQGGDVSTYRWTGSAYAIISNFTTEADVKALYESNANTNEFSDAEKSKLAGIESGATADQTEAEINTAYESNANTNEFSDAEQTKLANIDTDIQTAAVANAIAMSIALG